MSIAQGSELLSIVVQCPEKEEYITYLKIKMTWHFTLKKCEFIAYL